MSLTASIFLDINLPNAATWFYFSLLLAIALFFKFNRLLSMRNLDVISLFLLVPGLLLLQEGHNLEAVRATRVFAAGGEASAASPAGIPPAASFHANASTFLPASRHIWYGYVWLLAGSGYFVLRCLADLVLVRRPALNPNLNFSGLAWLAGTLFLCLVGVAIWLRGNLPEVVGKRTIPVVETQRSAEQLVEQTREIAAVPQEQFRTEFWVERTLAMLCHFAIVAGLIIISRWHFQDSLAGMAAGTFYLLLPYTAIHVTQIHHVWPTALLVWAFAFYRAPAIAGFLLGLAAGSVYFPALLFPVWFSFYWKRGAGRFTRAFLVTTGICLVAVLTILWRDEGLSSSLRTAVSLPDWQAWKPPNTEGFWRGVHWAYRLPVFILYVAFVLMTFFWPRPKNLAHVLALSALILIGIQFWYADQGGVYVLWYLPLLLILTFRPNLSDREATGIGNQSDWLSRSAKFLLRHAGQLIKPHQPLTRVQ